MYVCMYVCINIGPKRAESFPILLHFGFYFIIISIRDSILEWGIASAGICFPADFCRKINGASALYDGLWIRDIRGQTVDKHEAHREIPLSFSPTQLLEPRMHRKARKMKSVRFTSSQSDTPKFSILLFYGRMPLARSASTEPGSKNCVPQTCKSAESCVCVFG